MKFAVNDRVRVRPGVDIFAGLVGTVVHIDEAHGKMPYVVREDGAPESAPNRHFAESEIERAPIETKVVEGVVEQVVDVDRNGFVNVCDGRGVSVFDGLRLSDEVRIIIEVLRRKGA